jgi:ATP-dependent DNA ligase
MRFNGHEIRDGELIRQHACKLVSEGIVSKTADAPYAPAIGAMAQDQCLNRQEFVIVGWTDQEGSRPDLGALLLGDYHGRRQAHLRRPPRDQNALDGA